MMEQWCSHLLPAIKSCLYPYKSLSRRHLAIAQENSILAQYNLFDVIRGLTIDPDEPRLREEVLSEGMYSYIIVIPIHRLAD